MGVNLRPLVPRTAVRLRDLSGRIVAIDAYNTLYQFLAIIRQPNGKPLQDKTGKITSHLSGLFYRTSNIVEIGIKPVYIFDGTPPDLKEVEIMRRKKLKQEALVRYEQALAEGRIEEARVYAQATSRLKNYMTEDSKRLLKCMGIPWIQAPSEGEAQAAHLTKLGDSDYCGSQDYDSLLFGAPRLIRNLTISGRRKLPKRNVHIEVFPEVVELKKVLEECEITHEQLIDVGILIGTDFNPEGTKGLGPKTALKIVKEYGNIESGLRKLKKFEFQYDIRKIREIFLQPKVTNSYRLEWKDIDIEGTIDFICGEKDFSEDRVRKALEKMQKSKNKQKGKTTLEKWFG